MPSKLDFLPAIELCNSLVQEPQPMYHRIQKHWVRGIPHTDAFLVDVWDPTFDTPRSSPNFDKLYLQIDFFISSPTFKVLNIKRKEQGVFVRRLVFYNECQKTEQKVNFYHNL